MRTKMSVALMSIVSLSLTIAPNPLQAAGYAGAPAAEAVATPGPIAAVEPSVALKSRAEDVIRLLNGEADPSAIFSSAILAKVPAARLVAVAGAVRGKYGRALGVSEINAETPNKGQVLITFEGTQFPLTLGVEDDSPNLINALLF